MAKRLLQVNTYEIEPSVELFEYLNVLNYVSSSDFASIDEFAEIWIKYMGPDIRIYYNEAYQNLKDLDLESQIQKVGEELRKLNQIDNDQKISIRTQVSKRADARAGCHAGTSDHTMIVDRHVVLNR